MSILSSSTATHGVKEAAGQTVMCLLEYRPKLLAKSDMVKPMMISLVQIIALSNASGAGSLFVMDNSKALENEEEEDLSDDQLNQQLAQSILDSMAINIPSKYFTENALNTCSAVCMHIFVCV